MSENKMIKPMIRLKMNQCPKCLGRLELVEEETYIGAVDTTGIPIGGESYIEIRLRCTHCHEEYPAIKKGARYTIAPSTKSHEKIMPDYNPFYI